MMSEILGGGYNINAVKIPTKRCFPSEYGVLIEGLLDVLAAGNYENAVMFNLQSLVRVKQFRAHLRREIFFHFHRKRIVHTKLACKGKALIVWVGKERGQ